MTRMAGGRLVGALLLLQMTGMIALFIMVRPMSSGDYLHTTAPAAAQVRLGAILLSVNTLLAPLIALLTLRSARPAATRLGVALLAVSGAVVLFQLLDTFLHMLPMVAASVNLPNLDSAALQAARELGARRRIVHYCELFSFDLWVVLFYACLLRLRLAPAWLSWFGMLTVGLALFGLQLPIMLGKQGITALGASLALSALVSSIWLMAKGFRPGSAEL